MEMLQSYTKNNIETDGLFTVVYEKTYKQMDLLQSYKKKHTDRWTCYNRIENI
jgi:hypothetical protein